MSPAEKLPNQQNFSDNLLHALNSSFFSWESTNFSQKESANYIEKRAFDKISNEDRVQLFKSCPNLIINVECNDQVYSLPGSCLTKSDFFKNKIVTELAYKQYNSEPTPRLVFSIETKSQNQAQSFDLFFKILRNEKTVESCSLEEFESVLSLGIDTIQPINPDIIFFQKASRKFGIEILKYADTSLRNNMMLFFSPTHRMNPEILQYIGPNLQEDISFIRYAVKDYGDIALRYASKSVQKQMRNEVEIGDDFHNGIEELDKASDACPKIEISFLPENQTVFSLMALRIKRIGKSLYPKKIINCAETVFQKIKKCFSKITRNIKQFTKKEDEIKSLAEAILSIDKKRK
ncbi:MAG: hypothetical protein QRY74_02135 [Chlamydia sp.]